MNAKSPTDDAQDEPMLTEQKAIADWWLANPNITPLKLNQAALDLLLYGNAYLDVDTGFPIKARDIKSVAE